MDDPGSQPPDETSPRPTPPPAYPAPPYGQGAPAWQQQAWQQQAWQPQYVWQPPYGWQPVWGYPPAAAYPAGPAVAKAPEAAAEPPLAWRSDAATDEGARSSTPYVVELLAPLPARSSRLWAIFGLLAIKPVLLLPHVVVLAVLAVLAWLSFVVAQIVVVFSASYPRPLYDFVAGTLRWSVRVRAFLLGLTDRYPPFTFKGCDRCSYPVDLVVYHPPRSSRLWAINVVLSWAFVIGLIDWSAVVWLNSRTAALLPHLLIVGPLLAAGMSAWLVATVLVVGRGRYPRGLHTFIAGVLSWSARIEAFWLGLEDRYPPFELPGVLAEPPDRVWRQPQPVAAAAPEPPQQPFEPSPASPEGRLPNAPNSGTN